MIIVMNQIYFYTFLKHQLFAFIYYKAHLVAYDPISGMIKKMGQMANGKKFLMQIKPFAVILEMPQKARCLVML